MSDYLSDHPKRVSSIVIGWRYRHKTTEAYALYTQMVAFPGLQRRAFTQQLTKQM